MSSGSTPPRTAPRKVRLRGGEIVDLGILAADACMRYGARYRDEEQRYGRRWRPWCEHDMRYLLAWAAADTLDQGVSLGHEVRWLADLLEARGYPAARLSDALLIAADVVAARVEDPSGQQIVRLLQETATDLRGPARRP